MAAQHLALTHLAGTPSVWQCVSRAALPLLRRLALLQHWTGTSLAIPPPGHPLANDDFASGAAVEWDKEYLWLCAKMNLPTLLPPLPNPIAPAAPYYAPTAGLAPHGELGMAGGALWKMLEAWLVHLVQSRGGSSGSQDSEDSLLCCWRHEGVGTGQVACRVPGLVELPHVFQDLVNKYAELAHHKGRALGHRDSSAVCLSCGRCVWYRPPVSMQADGCCAHAAACGGGQGLFLSLVDTVVFLVQGEWVASWGSPYLDSHGEEDIGLTRGAKLCLDPARWKKLEELWR